MKETEYYSENKYDVLENKSMIHIFKKTIFGNLEYWRGVAKEYYTWEEDETEKGIMFIIRKKTDDAISGSDD